MDLDIRGMTDTEIVLKYLKRVKGNARGVIFVALYFLIQAFVKTAFGLQGISEGGLVCAIMGGIFILMDIRKAEKILMFPHRPAEPQRDWEAEGRASAPSENQSEN